MSERLKLALVALLLFASVPFNVATFKSLLRQVLWYLFHTYVGLDTINWAQYLLTAVFVAIVVVLLWSGREIGNRLAVALLAANICLMGLILSLGIVHAAIEGGSGPKPIGVVIVVVFLAFDAACLSFLLPRAFRRAASLQ